MDEGFHNVLSAICSAKLGYYGVLINCVQCQSMMICLTGD